MSYEELSKLAGHLLNQMGGKRTHSYPKVTMKSISLVQDDYYSIKEWIERHKRKNLVIKELHNIDPTLGLLNSRNRSSVRTGRRLRMNAYFPTPQWTSFLRDMARPTSAERKIHTPNTRCALSCHKKHTTFSRCFLTISQSLKDHQLRHIIDCMR